VRDAETEKAKRKKIMTQATKPKTRMKKRIQVTGMRETYNAVKVLFALQLTAWCNDAFMADGRCNNTKF